VQAAENPATPSGSAYWQAFASLPAPTAADQGPCVLYRIWIVPGVASVHATGTQLYILNAPLSVELAQVTHLSGQLLHPICPADAYYTGQEALLSKYILPQVQQEVNTLPQFEPLRRVYMSRVAAQWVRQVAGHNTILGRLVNSGLHRSQVAKPAWSPDAIWEEYLQQLDAPPMQWTIPVQVNGVTENETVMAYGGVDFRHKVRETNTSRASFRAHYPGLAAAARRATRRPTKIGSVTLVGGGITTASRHVRKARRPPALRIPRRLIPQSP